LDFGLVEITSPECITWLVKEKCFLLLFELLQVGSRVALLHPGRSSEKKEDSKLFTSWQ
jgi:hypothetical protein